jgi:hypothetical protein
MGMADPLAQSVDVAAELAVHSGDAWELLVDGASQAIWLGRGAHVPPVSGPATLTWAGEPWRRGAVVRVDEPAATIEVAMGPAAEWRDVAGTIVSLRVTSDPADPKHRSTVAVSERLAAAEASLPPPLRAQLTAFWNEVLGQLGDLAGRVERNRRPAQAVVVIHGIGEQVPGVTLDGFVSAVEGFLPGVQLRSKPDRISDSLELRRLSLSAVTNQDLPATDFFELYWAHHMTDTTPAQVLSWFRRLLWRRPGSVPRAIKPAWALAWVTAALALAALLSLVVGILSTAGILAVVSAVSLTFSVILSVLGGLLVKTLGDAARYLSARPDNVHARERIRTEGIELLERLHATHRYSRIVVVGHSLGSVIAYDLITHLWARMGAAHLNPRKVLNKKLRLLHVYDGQDPVEAMELQHAAWKELRRNTQPWLITDLVTMGSPLTYAPFLMGYTDEGFGSLKERRQLPTAPPLRDENPDEGVPAFWYQDDYTDRDGRPRRSFRYLHHAAPFAVVRWSNLYFPSRFGMFGDPVGGPVRDLFGPWIRDRELIPPAEWPKLRRLWLHSRYWQPPPVGRRAAAERASPESSRTSTPIEELRDSLSLEGSDDLERENAAHSPVMYLPEPHW